MNFDIDPREINLQGPDGMQLVKLLRGLIAAIESGGDEPEPGEDSEIFYCTYGTTTYSEIQNALAEDKVPICIRNGLYYYLVNTTQNRYVFACYNPTNNYIYAVRCLTDRWDNVTFMLQERLTWDYAPTQGSIRPVTSGGVWTALQNAGGSDIDPYQQYPEMDGTASPGSSGDYARGDHVHPTDTSRAAATDITRIDAALAGKADAATVEQFASDAADAWLDENVAQETGYVLDASLTMGNAAAPADKVGEIKSLVSLDKVIVSIAQENGYYNVVPLAWESGSINYPAGTDKNPDVKVIRTPLPRIQLSGDIAFILLNNRYRIRYYTFPDSASNATSQSNWYTNPGKYTIAIDSTKYYRIQIATNTATSMNTEDALKSILVVYRDNAMKEKVLASALPFDWEDGGLYYANGTNINSVSSIRTVEPRYFSTSYHVNVLDSNLHLRAFRYLADGTYDSYHTPWIPDANPYADINIDPSKKYRFDIVTVDGSAIDIYSALKNVQFVPIDMLGYWQDYLSEKESLVNSYMQDGTNKTAFLFLTDTHYNQNPTYLNSRGINADLMRHFANNTNIKYCIHGGDLNSEYRSDKSMAIKLMTRPMAIMRNAFTNVLVTRGNHDDNNEGGQRNWSYTISQASSYSYMFRNTQNAIFGETGTYFYHDIPFEKVRIISLDCIDFPYTNSNDASLLDEKMVAYGHEQMQWLCDTLASTPSGYHIVIYTHAMLAPSIVTIEHPADSPQTRAKNYLVPVNILKAYKNRQNYSENMTGTFSACHSDYFTGTLSKDFSSCDATIVGVFSGHEHVDCIEEILDANSNGIGIYNTCTQNSSNPFANSVISHSYQHPMQIGTTSELVWDVVIIDRENYHVDMIRIGANAANTDIGAVSVRSFNYT